MSETGTDFDRAALESYLSGVLDEDVVGTEPLHDGLNLTIGIATRNGDRAYVLRRPRKLRHTDLFNDLEREYRVLERLEGTGVPTPSPVAYCEDESLLGGRFIVTTHLDGDPVPMGDPLTDRFPTAETRARLADRLIGTMADLHSVDTDRFDGVVERHGPLDQVDRIEDRLDRATGVTGREVPALRRVVDWLRNHAPPNPETALVHGDFKPGNVLFAGTHDPELTGVLDWETAVLADPGTELGYLLLYWRDDGDPTPSLDDLEARHGDEPGMDGVGRIAEEGFYPFTTLPGSPTRRELVARYEEATGTAFGDDRFYRAHAALGLATVWEDLHRHQVEAGAASDYPPLSDYAATIATAIVDGEFPL